MPVKALNRCFFSLPCPLLFSAQLSLFFRLGFPYCVMEEMESFKKELLEIVMDVTEFLPEAG